MKVKLLRKAKTTEITITKILGPDVIPNGRAMNWNTLFWTANLRNLLLCIGTCTNVSRRLIDPKTHPSSPSSETVWLILSFPSWNVGILKTDLEVVNVKWSNTTCLLLDKEEIVVKSWSYAWAQLFYIIAPFSRRKFISSIKAWAFKGFSGSEV